MGTILSHPSIQLTPCSYYISLQAALAAEAEALKISEAEAGPVGQVRSMVQGGAKAAEVAAFVKQLVVPGGLPGVEGILGVGCLLGGQ